VKNRAKANAYRRLASPISVVRLSWSTTLGDWKYINTSADRTDAVTAGTSSAWRRTLPHEGDARWRSSSARRARPRKIPIAKLPPEAQAMVRQNLKQIESETDVARLQEGIAQMRQMAGQVPPEMKAALDIVLKRAEERLSALSSEKK
jgi:hypothetical protein